MNKKSAFTLIEIMIAISVFAIGVLAVLRLITQNLVTLEQTQARTTATFLAKESMALLYTMRDSNAQKLLPWDCVLRKSLLTDNLWNVEGSDDVCERYLSSGAQEGTLLQVSFDPASYMLVGNHPWWSDFSSLYSGNTLYYYTGTVGGKNIFRYSNLLTGWGSPSGFARYLLLTGVRDGNAVLPLDKILKIESHVLYMKWATTGEVVLEGMIANN